MGNPQPRTSKNRSGELPHLLIHALFVCFFGFLIPSSTTCLYRPKTERATILRAATHETELGGYDFCFSQSHYTYTVPTSGERAATAGIEPPGPPHQETPPPPPSPVDPGDSLSVMGKHVYLR